MNGVTLGWLYEFHPHILGQFDLPPRTAGVTLDMDQLMKLTPKVKVPASIPAFPAVSYDETLPIPANGAVGPLLKEIQKRTPLLADIEIVNLYESNPADRRLTVRCTYRAADRTLTEAEVKREHEGVLATLKNHLANVQ